MILAARAWASLYGNKPPSEDEIRHAIERQGGPTALIGSAAYPPGGTAVVGCPLSATLDRASQLPDSEAEGDEITIICPWAFGRTTSAPGGHVAEPDRGEHGD